MKINSKLYQFYFIKSPEHKINNAMIFHKSNQPLLRGKKIKQPN